MAMANLNLILLNIGTLVLITQAAFETSNTLPHELECSSGKIFLHAACFSKTNHCQNNDRLTDKEIEELHRNCSNFKRCTFQTTKSDMSVIKYACEDENLHMLSDLIEKKGLQKTSHKYRFYYDGIEHKSTDRGLLCIIKSISQMNVYRNWIQINTNSSTVLEMVELGVNTTYSTGDRIYRENTKIKNGTVIVKLVPDPGQHDLISLGFTSQDNIYVNCTTFLIPTTMSTVNRPTESAASGTVKMSTLNKPTESAASGTVKMSTLDKPTESVDISGTVKMSTLDKPTESADISGEEVDAASIIVSVVCVAIIAITIVGICILCRRRKKYTARTQERRGELTNVVSIANNYSVMFKENNQLKSDNYDYASVDDKPEVGASNPQQKASNNTDYDDVIDYEVSRGGKKIVNMKQLESRVKSSGYSEPKDALKPTKISSKASEYAEPCIGAECFTSRCVQNKSILQNYENFQKPQYPESKDNAYNHIGSDGKGDDYDHFDSVRGNNSRLPDDNYSHIPVNEVDEDDYNTANNVWTGQTTPNPNYDHCN